MNILSAFDANESKPETMVKNLHHSCPDMTIRQLKQHVADVLVAHLEPIRTRYLDIIKQGDAYLDSIEAEGARKARASAKETMEIVRSAVGLGSSL
jgi:tryptophanyl-tRNA synthetase